MIYKAYISVSFRKRESLDKEITAIVDTLKEFNAAAFVFVDQYKFDPSMERQMMKHAMNNIDQSDLLIAETSEKAIGVGIEVGYAKAKGKPVIYMRHVNAEHSTTVSGISDFQVEYESVFDLQSRLRKIFQLTLAPLR